MEQPQAHDPLIGATIGNYQVKTKLGEGGMGSVYMAEHPLIGKKVALKVLHAEFASNEDVVSRFFNEARAVNDIQHPNIVDIVDYGVIPQEGQGNMVYFIMEFLDGLSLADIVRNEAPLAPERALAIAYQIADALGSSHANQVVHRDLKPDNVILITRGREKDFVKVLDFGIAKLTGDQQGSRRTRTGIVMGTPAYMSPEQCEGRGNIDHRTDIYALGILLYEMLTGRVPFLGEGYGEVLVQHLTQAPARPSTIRGVIPPHVEAIVMKALEKRPEARFPTMEELMKAVADPVGYVERNGGLGGFLHSELKPTATAPPLAPTTPGPIAPLTPQPGTLHAPTPAPGQMYQPTPAPGQVQTPTTLGQGAGQQVGTGPYYAEASGGGSRLPLIIGAVIAVIALAVGGIFVLGGGGGDEQAAAADDETTEDEDETTPDEETDETNTDETDTDETDTDTDTDTTAANDTDTTDTTETTEPVEPEPVLVPITIASRPRGADVFIGDEKKPRGKTPLTLQLPKSDEKVKVRLDRSGYHDKEKEIVVKAKATFSYRLRPYRRGPGNAGNSGNNNNNGGRGSLEGVETMEPTWGD